MKQILYVEDSATSQLLMRKYLVGIGELTITPSIRTANALVQERGFDLVVTDFLFPEGDAIDFIDQTRRSETGKLVPIVVVSSSMDQLLMSRVIRAGANDGVSKPINAGLFRALVERMLTQPYVRSTESPLIGVRCLQWTAAERYFQFCPDLNVSVSGASREEVTQQMMLVLTKRSADSAELGNSRHETIVTHLVKSPVPG